MLTFADERGLGSEKFHQSVFMGKKNVHREDNWQLFGNSLKGASLTCKLDPNK